MAWPIIGRSFSPDEFASYVASLTWNSGFKPDGIVVHNTAEPCLANRPDGLTRQHLTNLEGYYKNTCGWNGGPHLFIDDKQIWVFNDLTKRGTHSPSWNASKLGIEMLGDYNKESFTEGRGLAVRMLVVQALAILNLRFGFRAGDFKFHVEDTKSDHDCPGKLARAERGNLIKEIEGAMAARQPEAAEPATAAVGLPNAVRELGKPGASQDVAVAGGILAGGIFGLFQYLWDFVLWLFGVLPAIATDVGGQLESIKRVTGWFSPDPMTWVKISACMAAALLVVAFVRRLKPDETPK